jgi:hypothetical protein
MTNSRKMRWDGHVVRMGEMKMHTKFGLESVKGSDNWEYFGVYGRIILRWILR